MPCSTLAQAGLDFYGFLTLAAFANMAFIPSTLGGSSRSAARLLGGWAGKKIDRRITLSGRVGGQEGRSAKHALWEGGRATRSVGDHTLGGWLAYQGRDPAYKNCGGEKHADLRVVGGTTVFFSFFSVQLLIILRTDSNTSTLSTAQYRALLEGWAGMKGPVISPGWVDGNMKVAIQLDNCGAQVCTVRVDGGTTSSSCEQCRYRYRTSFPNEPRDTHGENHQTSSLKSSSSRVCHIERQDDGDKKNNNRAPWRVGGHEGPAKNAHLGGWAGNEVPVISPWWVSVQAVEVSNQTGRVVVGKASSIPQSWRDGDGPASHDQDLASERSTTGSQIERSTEQPSTLEGGRARRFAVISPWEGGRAFEVK
ncbi:hypothetical protein QBC37DRAFT_378416, partial [Rhypophila decipiens]